MPVENVELGLVAGRSPDDETAAFVMTILLLLAIATYGNLVLTGVVEEKSSRVVEVLLARMPARNLLAGKVAGIGLLGFAQFAVTARRRPRRRAGRRLRRLPAVSGGVLAWVVVWFVLGYALYAMAYGALGSLASRTEDASSVAGPVSYVLIAGYWASLVAVGEDPDGGWSLLVSFFPATAPFAMPGRVALGVTAVVGAHARRRRQPGDHRRSRRVRRPGLHRGHPPHRPHPPAARRLAGRIRAVSPGGAEAIPTAHLAAGVTGLHRLISALR